jgi:hypothetical protein
MAVGKKIQFTDHISVRNILFKPGQILPNATEKEIAELVVNLKVAELLEDPANEAIPVPVKPQPKDK